MAATTFAVLLKAALRKAGVTLAPGRGPSTDQYAEAIGEINRFIGGLNCDPLAIFTKRIDVWNTVSGQKAYTLGKDPQALLTANWDGPRPQKITFANLFLPTSPVYRRKMNILTDEQWGAIRYQDILTYPAELYNDGGDDHGMCTIYLHPVPDAVYQIELYTWQAVQTFAATTDIVILPPGYEDMLVNNAAVRLASMPWPHQMPMNPQVRMDAVSSLARIQAMNAKSPKLKTDQAFRSGGSFYNYLTGLME